MLRTMSIARMLSATAIVLVTMAFTFESFKHNDAGIATASKATTVQGYWPVSNLPYEHSDVITSPFGPRGSSSYQFHEGIDISTDAISKPVYAAFDGTVHLVEFDPPIPGDISQERYVFLRHIDPEDPFDPNDDTIFYTFSDHFDYTSDLERLNDLEGDMTAVITAGSFQQYHNTYLINPIGMSHRSGLTTSDAIHLHFSGRYPTTALNDAINPMRDDSLPYSNQGDGLSPRIENAQLELIPGTSNDWRLTFSVNTSYLELDLNVITVFDGGIFRDRVLINFDLRVNTPTASNGTIATKTTDGHPVTIKIKTYNFTPGTNQIMDFTFDLPRAWALNPALVEVEDTQTIKDNEAVYKPIVDVDEIKNMSSLPISYNLSPNFPNPFNPSTTIRFAVPQKALVSLAIFDERGGLVRELASDKLYQPGWSDVVWDGTNNAGLPVSSGVYFYRMNAQGLHDKRSFTQTRKLTLLK